MNKKVKIIYGDDALVVIVKPGGLLSVPGRGPENQDCISSRLQAIYPEMIAQPAVHRLDMHTSGLMVYAVDKQTHRSLSIQFQNKAVEKKYIAVLEGEPFGEEGEIRLPFRLDIDNRPLQIYDPIHGKLGITGWRKLEVANRRTRVEFTPYTGRTHQLRVHAAHHKGLGCPIVGDSFYGSGENGDEMLLHASFLAFTHPLTGCRLSFHDTPPF